MTSTDYRKDESTSGSKSGRRPVWHRGLFMLFFMFAFSIAQTILVVIAVVQFLSLLIGGRPNDHVAGFGRSLGLWLDQVALFQSADSDKIPFPWSDWP